MSNVAAGRGVSTAHLVAFIVVILIAGVASYLFYSEADRFRTKTVAEQDSLKTDQEALVKAGADRLKYLNAMGFDTRDEIEMTYLIAGKSSATGPDNTARFDVDKLLKPAVVPDDLKLEALLQEQVSALDAKVQNAGIDIKQIDVTRRAGSDPAKPVYESSELDQKLAGYLNAGAVPPDKEGTLLGKIIAQRIRRDQARQAEADERQKGQAAVAAVDQKIAARHSEIESTRADLNRQVADAHKVYITERDKLRTESPKWTETLAEKQTHLDREKTINARLEDKRKVQVDETSPVDGVILTYDWKSRRGTVNLGAMQGIKAGYEFNIFTTRPGPEGPDKRIFVGKMQLLNVYSNTSLFTMIESDWEDPARPIMPGLYVRSKIFDPVSRRIFVLKGWFPPGGDYTKEALAGRIFKQGGIVQDDLTLKTDSLVLGRYDAAKMTDLSDEGKRLVAEGDKAFKDAEHMGSCMVLDVKTLLKYLDQSGIRVEP